MNLAHDLTYLASSEINIVRMLSVCPTSFPVRFPDRGSHIRITRSGEPLAMAWPYGSAARAYMEALGAVASGGVRVKRDLGVGDDEVRSHSLMVRSKEPDTIQFGSRLD
jgi:hypothetical protein